jgi:hypothetical protein
MHPYRNGELDALESLSAFITSLHRRTSESVVSAISNCRAISEKSPIKLRVIHVAPLQMYWKYRFYRGSGQVLPGFSMQKQTRHTIAPGARKYHFIQSCK